MNFSLNNKWLRNFLMAGLIFGCSSVGYAATWCGSTEILDVICYSEKSCYITANSYGGDRYYRIDGEDPNKKAMLSIALTAYASDSKARLAFYPDNMDCNNIPQETRIYGVGATRG